MKKFKYTKINKVEADLILKDKVGTLNDVLDDYYKDAAFRYEYRLREAYPTYSGHIFIEWIYE